MPVANPMFYIFRDHCLDGEAEPPSPAPGPPSSTWSARRTSPTRPRISTSAPESGTTMSSSRLEMGGTRTTTYDAGPKPTQMVLISTHNIQQKTL